MIKSDREYKITTAARQKFIDAYEELSLNMADAGILGRAHYASICSEIDVLTGQLLDYEGLVSSVALSRPMEAMDKLPNMLIAARLARGMSQEELANLIQCPPSDIQRYEANDYEWCPWWQMVEIGDALDVTITGTAIFYKES